VATSCRYAQCSDEAAHPLLTRSRKWSWLKACGIRVAQRRGMRRAIVAVTGRSSPDVGRRQRDPAPSSVKVLLLAEKCPHGNDRWGEFAKVARFRRRKSAVKIVPPHPSHLIMRRPLTPTSKRSESLVWASSSRNTKCDSLTSGAIEKGLSLGARGNDAVAPPGPSDPSPERGSLNHGCQRRRSLIQTWGKKTFRSIPVATGPCQMAGSRYFCDSPSYADLHYGPLHSHNAPP
jgi:hypothetical protein